MRWQPRELLRPLNFAAYLAWGAIGNVLWTHPPQAVGLLPATLPAWAIAIGLHALFLLLFVATQVLSASRPAMFALLAGQAATALAGLLVSRESELAVLLIVVIAQLAAVASARATVLAFVAINAALYAIQAAAWHWGSALQATLLYASFQAFAALTAHYAATAERARDALALVNADLLATRSLLAESARDQERLRLSRELHDVAGHKLTALKLNLASMAAGAGSDATPVRLCAQLADELLHDLRGVVEQMRLHDGMDLRAAIARLGAPFPRPRVHVAIGADARVGSVDQADAVLRAVQEALTNAARHAAAENVWIALSREGDRIVLDVRDDGRQGGAVRSGNGLRGMRERLEAIGGGLAIDRGEAGGVHLHAWLPAAA